MKEYYNALDRGFYEERVNPNAMYHSSKPVKDEPAPDSFYSTRNIGTTGSLSGPTANPIALAQAELKKGTGHLEIASSSSGRGGSPQQRSWAEVGADEREALRDIQRSQKGTFDISTHAAVDAWGGTGFDAQSGNYSEKQKSFVKDEVKKAIDFAAEGTFGGSVVMHAGEFRRNLHDMPGYEGMFGEHEGEDEEALYGIVNAKEKKFIGGVSKKIELNLPVLKKDENTGEIVYRQKINDQGELENVKDIFDNPIPEYEISDTGEVKTKSMSFADFIQESLDNPDKRRKIETYVEKFTGSKQIDTSNPSVYVKEIAAKLFYENIVEQQVSQELAQTQRTQEAYKQAEKQRDRILETLQVYTKLKHHYGDNWKKYTKQAQTDKLGILPPETVDPVEYLKDQLAENDRLLASQRTTAAALGEAEKKLKQINDLKTEREFALEESRNTYAELGIYAMQRTNEMTDQLKRRAKQIGKKFDETTDKKLIKPIAITIENLFPTGKGQNQIDSYGSTADEMIDIIEGTRKRMVELLTQENVEKDGRQVRNPYFQKGMSVDQAKKEASDHVRMTFDTGHLNMWRKFWVGDKSKTKEENDKAFNKWYLEQVEKLADKDLIGNVHIADNYGLDDAHLAPGEGNTPIKDTMEILRKKGVFKNRPSSIAQEGGWIHGKDLRESWKLFNSPIFSERMMKENSDKWVNFSSSDAAPQWSPLYGSGASGPTWSGYGNQYQGRVQKPYFLFANNNPGKPENSKPWSELPLE